MARVLIAALVLGSLAFAGEPPGDYYKNEAWGSLAESLGHAFKDPELLQRAVTHRSLSQTIGHRGHYERLEFLLSLCQN